MEKFSKKKRKKLYEFLQQMLLNNQRLNLIYTTLIDLEKQKNQIIKKNAELIKKIIDTLGTHI